MSTYNAIRYNNPYANAGSLILLSTQTASSSASIEFTSGLTSSYKEYLFIFNNLHPSDDDIVFRVNFSTDGGSNYNVVKTSSAFYAEHTESDSIANLTYHAGGDLAQSSAEQTLCALGVGNDNDQSLSGTLHLFNPSSTTYVKHYLINTNIAHSSDYSIEEYIGGYCNTTSAINAVRFICNTGNIDAGTIQMFGVVS